MATNKNFIVKNGLEVAGNISVTGSVTQAGQTMPATDGTAGQYLQTDGSGNLSWATVQSSFDITDGTNTDTVNTGETLSFTAGTGITIAVSDNDIEIGGVAQYTDSDAIAAVQGATDLSINSGVLQVKTALSRVGIGISAPQVALDVAGDIGISGTTVIDSGGEVVTAQLKDSGVTAATYGSSTAIPYVVVDAKGRITSAGTNPLAITTFDTDDLTEGSTNLYYTDARVDSHLSGGTGVTYSSGTISIGQAVATTSDVTFNDIQADGNLIITGNLTVNGTTTTVNSNTVNIGDNIIVLNSDETGTPSQDAGIEIERGTSSNVTLIWDESATRWSFGSNDVEAQGFIGNLTGTASDSSSLGGVSAANYLRSDTSDTYAGSMLTLGGNIKGGASSWFDIYSNTSDGSDNRTLRIGGGGDVSVNRGAFISLAGNESSNGVSSNGSISIQTGNVANASLIINPSGYNSDFIVESDSGTHSLFVDGQYGTVSINTDNTKDSYDAAVAGLYVFPSPSSSNSGIVIQSQGYNTTTPTASLHFRHWDHAGIGYGGKIVSQRRNVYNETANSKDNALDFYTTNNGVEYNRLRIDYNGNVGIGTNGYANETNMKFQVNDTVLIRGNSSADGSEIRDWPTASLNLRRTDTHGANGIRMISIGYRDDPLYNTGDAVANISIWEEVSQAGSRTTSNSDTQLRMCSPGPLLLGSGGTNARIHLTNNGVIGFGKNSTTQQPNDPTTSGMYYNHITAATPHLVIANTIGDQSHSPLYLNRQGSNGSAIIFRRANADVGTVSVTTTGTTYNTTSDRRLKENIEPIENGKDILNSMKPCTFTFKADPLEETKHGFIAQEMQEIMPEAVSGEDGSEDMMSMDYGRITPVIVAALQDALKEIEELKTRINELENK